MRQKIGDILLVSFVCLACLPARCVNANDKASIPKDALTLRLMDLEGRKEIISDEKSGIIYPSAETAVSWLTEFHRHGKWIYKNAEEKNDRDVLGPIQRGIHHSKDKLFCGHSTASKRKEKRNVLIVPAGSTWKAENWLDRPEDATFDIIAIYHGDDPEKLDCPLCAEVYKIKGPKWRLYYKLTSGHEWSSISKKYDYIMLPDDDLQMDTCSINAVFEMMRRHDLLLGQPSVCEGSRPGTWRPDLHQRVQYDLRFVTFVEVMAPTFRMDFFDEVVRHTFSRDGKIEYYRGLDSIWPALLRYPKDRIAIIDVVCMSHEQSEGGLGASKKEGSVYRPGLSPFTPKQEEKIVFLAFNYTKQATSALDQPYMSLRVLGGILNYHVVDALSESIGVQWPTKEHAVKQMLKIDARYHEPVDLNFASKFQSLSISKAMIGYGLFGCGCLLALYKAKKAETRGRIRLRKN